MPFLPEFIAIAVVVIALLYYIISKIANSNAAYKSGKLAMLERYKQLRARSNNLQDKMSSYIMENHIENEPFTEEYTYADFLRQLQKNHIKHLSDKNYSRIKNTNNRVVLNAAKTTLKNQEIKLDEVEQKLNQLGLQRHAATPLPSGQD
ncbi:hypothetical protein ACLI09_11785 [Flavobacterium sp. RHBU_24]|uniref:hypothetical protein n=1 Tax=Flavobacterium sp. RHBU_24 TaxID=3391185 RepID=UPI0039849B5E